MNAASPTSRPICMLYATRLSQTSCAFMTASANAQSLPVPRGKGRAPGPPGPGARPFPRGTGRDCASAEAVMNAQIVWDNLVAYSLQIGLLVGLAAFIPAALGLRLPASRLAYWHVLLAACLLLPAVRPWKQAALTLYAYGPVR